MKKMTIVLGLLSLLLLVGAFTYTGATATPAHAAAVQNHTVQAASSCPPTVSEGSTGTAVRWLQYALTSRGFPVKVDGDFGPKTKAAVIGFQRAVGLTPDGIAGPKTWDALGEC